MLEGLFLILLGLLMATWSLTVSAANLKPAPELTGLDLTDTGDAVSRPSMRMSPEEIEPGDVTLMHVDQTRYN